MTDVFGDIVDSDWIEQAAKATLEAWLPAHLAHQERRRGLPSRTLPQPRSWPTVSEFDPLPHEQLPSIVLVSPGTSGAPDRTASTVRATWRLEVVAAVAGKDEPEARLLGSLYAAAIRGALEQNGTLGGIAERTRWQGDDHAVGNTERGPRWMGEVQFLVTLRDVIDPRLGPTDPPPDPYEPPAPLEPLDTPEITVEPHDLSEELSA